MGAELPHVSGICTLRAHLPFQWLAQEQAILQSVDVIDPRVVAKPADMEDTSIKGRRMLQAQVNAHLFLRHALK